jgi:hypothetical protein
LENPALQMVIMMMTVIARFSELSEYDDAAEQQVAPLTI